MHCHQAKQTNALEVTFAALTLLAIPLLAYSSFVWISDSNSVKPDNNNAVSKSTNNLSEIYFTPVTEESNP